jgi:hypothetical protein
MSKLRKDDVVYYRRELIKLFNQAKENGINIEILKGAVYFQDHQTREVTQVCVEQLEQRKNEELPEKEG